MAEYVSVSIVEHLRNQDGKLFQDEKVLSLQTDTKAFVWTQISSLMRTHSFQSSLKQAAQVQMDWDDSTSEDLLKKMLSVRPQIVEDLAQVVEAQQTLLQRTHFRAIVTETQVSGLLRGLFKRIIAHDCFASKALLDQDPIKIDFLFREAFRMTLLHDCTILVSESRDRADSEVPKPVESIVEPESAESEHEKQDSAAEEVVVVIPDSNQVAMLDDEHESASAVADDEAPSELRPKEESRDDRASIVSRAMSALSQASNSIRKPRVRTIIFDDDRSAFSRK